MSPSKQLRDAAIVLNSLPDEMVSDVLSRLDDESQNQLTELMDSLQEISGEEFHQISRRFRKLTLGGAKQEVAPALDPLLWPRDTTDVSKEPFSFLMYMDSDSRQQLLEVEHPLNVAMLLTTLTPEFASSITRELDPAFRISVIRRLCDLDIVDEAKLMELRFDMRMRAKRMLVIANCTGQGLRVAADLLSLTDQRTRDGVIALLSDRDQELGAELEKRVFTMVDLLTFSDAQIAKLLRKVDTSAWAGALRSTKPSVGKRILESMARRAADIVTAEMAAFDPLNERAMHRAVEHVVGVAMKLRDDE
jgi:flagellar motor switch protein FliG